MRLLLALCATAACCFGSSALALEATTDAQRLNAAAFAHRSSLDEWQGTHGYSTLGLQFGSVKIVPMYSIDRTAESWRLPESGQDMTTTQMEFKAYMADHPLVKFGFSALMRSGRHKEVDPRDPAAFASRLGHEPDRKEFKLRMVIPLNGPK